MGPDPSKSAIWRDRSKRFGGGGGGYFENIRTDPSRRPKYRFFKNAGDGLAYGGKYSHIPGDYF